MSRINRTLSGTKLGAFLDMCGFHSEYSKEDGILGAGYLTYVWDCKSLDAL